MSVPPPLAVLAELTHRCPLGCPYCSNPLQLERAADEIDTAEWQRVIDEAAELGVLQVHFSGGEPLARRDLETLVAHAARAGLYTNLITSGILLDAGRLAALVDAGLDHIQLSFQDTDPASADSIAHYAGGHARKLAAAALVRQTELSLTVNVVVHRRNIGRVAAMIDMAASLGAARIEIAHAQYYGWALRNRAALLPTREQVDAATAAVDAARVRLKGILAIDYVVPDYHARLPKACMGGWGRQFLNITPSGKVLPCHAAETIGSLAFENVRERPLAAIWNDSPAFNRFRGTGWMREPCKSCPRREIDWGGCRCQAFALSGEADLADPACALSCSHARMQDIVAESQSGNAGFMPRRFGEESPGHAAR